MRIEVSYQSELSQDKFNEAFPEVVYCFGERFFKVKNMLSEAKKYGSGVLFVVNGKNVVEQICF